MGPSQLFFTRNEEFTQLSGLGLQQKKKKKKKKGI